MKRICYLNILITIVISLNVFSYDNKITHKDMMSRSIEKANLNKYLLETLDLSISTYLDEDNVIEILREGAYFEDEPNCRASNHFHNPIEKPLIADWRYSGAQDIPGVISLFCTLCGYPQNDVTSNIYGV